MKREELLKSKEYWLAQIQNDLYGAMKDFMKKEKLNRTKLAQKMKVSKGYITQVLNGDFDHKLSKLVQLSLACNSVPLLHFVDLNKFIKEDSEDKIFELVSTSRKMATYDPAFNTGDVADLLARYYESIKSSIEISSRSKIDSIKTNGAVVINMSDYSGNERLTS